jgi:predicted RNase H-like HicB family nuclease
MKATDYPIFLIYSEDEEAWLAHVDQLPGLIVDGPTQEEALSNAKSAINNWIETTKELGRSVPEPLSEEKFHQIQADLAKKQAEFLQQAFNQAVAFAATKSERVSHLASYSTGAGYYYYSRGLTLGGYPSENPLAMK